MNRLTIHADLGKHQISRHLYGHFSEHLGRCIYGGYWVGEDSPIPNTRGIRKDVVAALRALKIPNLRWPGGCFADEYHWLDGIGPQSQRPCMVNTHWGGVTENNHFGTHEFMDLCEQLGCEPYVNGNVGSGTVQEMAQWVEYLNFDGQSPMTARRRANGREKPWQVTYWGVGNENWGCGGNMRPEYYADEFRRYATYCRNFAGNKLFRIACGASDANYQWTEVLMREAARYMDGLTLHYYTIPGVWQNKKSALQFGETEWFTTLKKTLVMDELLTRHETIMDKYDPERRVALIVDEWGTWYDVEPGTNPGFLYQQNTMRDALVAGINLNLFNQHCDRVRMANIAQTVNVLQAMILTEGEQMILTPSYHVFAMYAVHQDATMLPCQLQCGDYTCGQEAIPALHASASRDSQGHLHLSLCHLDPNQPATLSCRIHGATVGQVSGQILSAGAMNAHNSFLLPQEVQPQPFTGASLNDGQLTVTLPPMAVVVLELE